jgi:hypothetical protein
MRSPKATHRCLFWLATVAALATQACNTEEIQVFTAEGAQGNVARFKTFGVLLPQDDELVDANIKPATFHRLADLSIDRMNGLGYQPIAVTEADLLLVFRPSLTLTKNLRTYTPSGRESDATTHTALADGTLTVTFVDVKGKAVLLKRVARARVDLGVNEEQMNQVVAGIFEDVPRALAP